MYLAGAWLFLEALGFVAENFGWPTYITRSAIVLAAVGFLAVLVLAWYHGEKGRQKASGVELFILAGILVIASAAVATLGREREEVPVSTAEQPEIVVTAGDRESSRRTGGRPAGRGGGASVTKRHSVTTRKPWGS